MRILLGLLAVATALFAADAKHGKPLTMKEPMTLATLLAQRDSYVGKTVQVKARVTEVCQAMGCWLQLADDQGHSVRFNAHEAGISFPKNSAGRTAIAEGKFVKTDLSRDEALAEAKEHAKDSGKPFDESKVKAGAVYSIDGVGAVLLGK